MIGIGSCRPSQDLVDLSISHSQTHFAGRPLPFERVTDGSPASAMEKPVKTARPEGERMFFDQQLEKHHGRKFTC